MHYPYARGVLSSPFAAARALYESALGGQLWIDIAVSLSRAIGGWAIASLVAAPLGITMARAKIVGRIVGPLLNVLRPISPVAWIPVAILWFGIGYGSKVFIVGIISFFVVLANSYQAASAIDPTLLKAARTFTNSPWKTAFHVVIPASIPGVAIGAQFALATAWGGVIIAEYTGAQSGVGFQMLRASNLFLPDRVMAGMVVVGVVGYLLNAAFRSLLKTRLARKYLS